MADNIQSHATDWREQLSLNTRKTYWVIALFILLYFLIGILLDVVIHYYSVPVNPYDYNQVLPTVPEILEALVTFKIIPWATIIMLGVAVVSLWITYSFYDRLMLLGTEYIEVTPQSDSLELKQLYNVVEEMKVAAGLRYMPKVYLINADYMNAFASGYSEKSAMVAITRGLLQKLDRDELQAVMAHELSHIRHGDIKLTLTAVILSNLMLMVIDVLFYNMLFSGRRRDGEERGGANILFIIIIVARYALPIITMILMLYLSRAREYMADAGCVELQRDNGPLIRALLKIHQDHVNNAGHYAAEYDSTAHESVRREAYIYDPVVAGIGTPGGPSDWFSTHPSLEKRLSALGYKE